MGFWTGLWLSEDIAQMEALLPMLSPAARQEAEKLIAEAKERGIADAKENDEPKSAR